MNTPVIEEPEPVTEEPEKKSERGEVTRLLEEWNNGDTAARERLLSLVYGELQRMAHLRLQREYEAHQVHTGTLAHEVCLRLLNSGDVPGQNHKEFFRLVGRQMLEVLIDLARKRNAKQRGGNQIHVPLEAATLVTPALNFNFFEFKEKLEMLEGFAPELSEVIVLHYFAGLTVEKIAAMLGVSTDKVKRRLQKARAYLHEEPTPAKGASNGQKPPETN